ncbi:hypothetical protein PHLCEN_2v12001 [Hermanssonia centrifuga]|uniref:Uncharacterized protein n=1 Tax=Hermanssonia centrifuga TaxID=98765 RepID=A0A2R6NIJ3_9APHY|nr:hypothetical protein PHLCEN_2v12001 [Hermanssonia centrifuga]
MAPSSGPRLDGAQLASIAVESVLYGVFVVLFVDSLLVLIERRRKRKDKATVLLFLTGFTLFSCMTAHWAIDLSRAFDAFIFSQDGAGPTSSQQTPADMFYSNVAAQTYVATSGLYVVIKATGDAFMASL